MKHLIYFLFFISLSAYGIVDIRSAGYSKTFIDFESQTKGYNLKVERTYNSRSLYNGLFGFGWCSNFETKLDILPDNSIKVAECGGGVENFYFPKNKTANAKLQTGLIMKKMKARKIKMSSKGLTQLRKDLIASQTLRADFLKSLEIKGKTTQGVTYFRNGDSNEFITVKNNSYQRKLPNGVTEIFNKKGKLVRSYEKNGSSMDITWGKQSVSVIDNLGNRLVLFLNSSKKIKSLKFNKKIKASYSYKGEDLVMAKNSYKETFRHEYNRFHDLVKTTYPDKTTESLKYNKAKDWVIGFKDRKNCEEEYTYAKNPKNPDHYFSTVQKKCGRKIVNKSKYEFWNKKLKNGSTYLYRARARVNGRLKTDVIYHPVFSSPVSFYKNGIRTYRTYYKNGFLKTKTDPYKTVVYKNYIKGCGKPSLVNVTYKQGKKVVKKESIRFSFKKNCQISMAKQSNDKWIKVQYDARGRLVYMEDQSRKKIKVVWHNKFNKPSLITRLGVGSVKVVYNNKGDVVSVKAGNNSGPTVVSQVSSVFNSFLQVLAPVAEEMVIL